MKRALLLAVALFGLAVGPVSASSVLGLSIEDQARLATLVVVGEVVAQQGVDHPDFGIETAVTVRVSETLKGSVKPGQTVIFYTHGGQVGEEISEAVGEAQFSTGKTVLVFIESVDGRLYNLGLSMGVFDVKESRRGDITVSRAVTDGLEVIGDAEVEYGPISLRDMATRIAWADRNPGFDHPLLRESRQGGR